MLLRSHGPLVSSVVGFLTGLVVVVVVLLCSHVVVVVRVAPSVHWCMCCVLTCSIVVRCCICGILHMSVGSLSFGECDGCSSMTIPLRMSTSVAVMMVYCSSLLAVFVCFHW